MKLEGVNELERQRVAAALAVHERLFLERHPDFSRALDRDRVRADVEARLARAARLETPVPHVVVPELLPADLYALFEAAWPAHDVFKRDARGRKLDLVPTNPALIADARAAGYELLPPSIRAVWDFFVFFINRELVGPWLARTFEPEIQERLTLLRRADAEGLIRYSVGSARDWSYRANVGRFMVRGNGYVLKPHVDSAAYLVTALVYFPEQGQDAGYGTIFYAPSRPLEFEMVVRSGSTEYFESAGVDCSEVLRVPYRHNTMLAFPNTLKSAHGVVAPEHGYRRVFQYHLSLKGDDEKV